MLRSMYGHAKQRIDMSQRSGAGGEDPFAGASQHKFWWTHLSWMGPYIGETKKGQRLGLVCHAKKPSPSTSSAVAGGSGLHDSTPSTSYLGTQGAFTPMGHTAAGPAPSWLGPVNEHDCSCKAGCCNAIKAMILRQ